MKTKHILGIVLFYFFQLLYSQTASRPVQADINWNGRMCNGGHGICYTQKDAQLTTRALVFYDKKYNELLIRIPQDQMSEAVRKKLLYRPVKDNVWLYTLDADNPLPEKLRKKLNLSSSSIRAGDYLILLKDKYFELHFKLT